MRFHIRPQKLIDFQRVIKTLRFEKLNNIFINR